VAGAHIVHREISILLGSLSVHQTSDSYTTARTLQQDSLISSHSSASVRMQTMAKGSICSPRPKSEARPAASTGAPCGSMFKPVWIRMEVGLKVQMDTESFAVSLKNRSSPRRRTMASGERLLILS